MVTTRDELAARLAAAGFIAAADESSELLERAAGDETLLASLLERRLRGEPLAWITGYARFCDVSVHVRPGVYVPRWQSEPLARRAVTRLPRYGVAIDLCTGSGAIAATLQSARPDARVVATDLDAVAVECAISNGVETYRGDLFEPLPHELTGVVDVIVAVVPYVPSSALSFLPRDTFAFESTASYDGGVEGVDFLRRVVNDSPRFLRPGGSLLMELGGEQAQTLRDELTRCGFTDVTVWRDEDDDVRGVEATFT